MAVVKVLEQCEACPTEIRTDSLYVWRGARAWQSWKQRGWGESHEDLWDRFSRAMQGKADGQMLFTKVKGHASWGDVRQGRVTRQNKVGNAMADFLAVQGAALHPSALPLAAHHETRVQFAKELQQMYLSILREQQQDTRDIEEAMFNVADGRFVMAQRQRRRRIVQAKGAPSGPGSKRRRLASAPVPLLLDPEAVDDAMQT